MYGNDFIAGAQASRHRSISSGFFAVFAEKTENRNIGKKKFEEITKKLEKLKKKVDEQLAKMNK